MIRFNIKEIFETVLMALLTPVVILIIFIFELIYLWRKK